MFIFDIAIVIQLVYSQTIAHITEVFKKPKLIKLVINNFIQYLLRRYFRVQYSFENAFGETFVAVDHLNVIL